jgi:hypothetical protein
MNRAFRLPIFPSAASPFSASCLASRDVGPLKGSNDAEMLTDCVCRSSAAGPDRRVDGMGIVYHPEKQRRASTSGTGRGGQGLLRAGGGRGAERERPGSAWKRRGDVGDGGDDADGGEEEHQLKMTAYVDHVYKVGRAFDLEGQERKIVEYNRQVFSSKILLPFPPGFPRPSTSRCVLL